MTIKNYDKLIETIKNDATLVARYFGDNGAACVIGGLAEAAGYDRSQFTYRFNSSGVDRGIPDVRTYETDYIQGYEASIPPMREAIEAEFGLTVKQQRQLQAINDGVFTLKERHRQLIAKVNEFVAEEVL